MEMVRLKPPLHITQHKRFAPYGTRSNFCFTKTSFRPETSDCVKTPLKYSTKFIENADAICYIPRKPY